MLTSRIFILILNHHYHDSVAVDIPLGLDGPVFVSCSGQCLFFDAPVTRIVGWRKQRQVEATTLFILHVTNIVQTKSAESQMNSNHEIADNKTKNAKMDVQVECNDKKPHFLQSMDGIVFSAYLCNVVALSLPVILLPMAASEHISTSAGVASTVAAVSSIATLGGAVGKFANGFICKELGSHTCSKYYLAGLSICSLLFSISPNAATLGFSFAGMEFAASSEYSIRKTFCLV